MKTRSSTSSRCTASPRPRVRPKLDAVPRHGTREGPRSRPDLGGRNASVFHHRLVVTFLVSLVGLGCDLPPADPSGPKWVGTDPSLVAGTPGTIPILDTSKLGVGAELRIIYDSPLRAVSVGRHTVTLQSGEMAPWTRVYADPSLPGLRILLYEPLIERVNYRVRVEGVRDLDGRLGQSAEFVVVSTATSPPKDEVVAWSEVAGIFETRCAGCHSGTESGPAALDLSSGASVRVTAIERAARGVAIGGPGAAVAVLGGGLFGSRLVVPGRPGDSYLLYKILGDPHIVGEPMPPTGDAGNLRLTDDEIRRITDWIATGAATDEGI